MCDCRKGFWHQQLDEAFSFLTTFNTELGSFEYTVVPFVATVAGDVFQCKLDECFSKIKQVIIITDDIMIVGYKPDHSDHDQASTNLLQTAQRSNVKLNCPFSIMLKCIGKISKAVINYHLFSLNNITRSKIISLGIRK